MKSPTTQPVALAPFGSAAKIDPKSPSQAGSTSLASPPASSAGTFKAPTSPSTLKAAPSPFGGLTSSSLGSRFGSSKVFGSGFASGFGTAGPKRSTFAASKGDIGEASESKKTQPFGAYVGSVSSAKITSFDSIQGGFGEFKEAKKQAFGDPKEEDDDVNDEDGDDDGDEDEQGETCQEDVEANSKFAIQECTSFPCLHWELVLTYSSNHWRGRRGEPVHRPRQALPLPRCEKGMGRERRRSHQA